MPLFSIYLAFPQATVVILLVCVCEHVPSDTYHRYGSAGLDVGGCCALASGLDAGAGWGSLGAR